MNTRMKAVRESLIDERGKKYTQTKFAETMHVSRDMVATYELGRVEPSDLYISTVCEKFNVSEKWLRFGIGEMREVKESSDFLELAQDLDLSADQYDIEIQEIAADLIRTWAELTPEYKRVILEVAHRFRDKKKKDR